jgi:hypothetical protein
MGFAPEDYEDDAVEVWPENWRIWALFCRVSTQWRTGGMGGYIGLDYTPIFKVMDMDGLTGQDWQNAFDDLRAIEAAALEQIRMNSSND